jgi:hypothetical protein
MYSQAREPLRQREKPGRQQVHRKCLSRLGLADHCARAWDGWHRQPRGPLPGKARTSHGPHIHPSCI